MTTEYQLAEVGVTADQLLPCECGPYGSHDPDDLRPATMPKRVRTPRPTPGQAAPAIPEGWRLVSIDSHYENYPYAAFIVEGDGMPDDAVMGTGDTWQDALRDAMTKVDV